MPRCFFAVLPCVILVSAPCVARAAACPGDLNHDGSVTINELVTLVHAALTGCGETPCPGDLNGDDTVSIDEVMQAVNAALLGCPPHCPYTFLDDTLTLGASCGYAGPFSITPACPTDLSALVLSDPTEGNLVAITVGSDPLITFGGVASSATEAAIVAYFVGDDLTPQPLSGMMQLTDDGNTLVIDPDTVPPFNIGGVDCGFDRYAGTFTGITAGDMRRRAQRPARLNALRALVGR